MTVKLICEPDGLGLRYLLTAQSRPDGSTHYGWGRAKYHHLNGDITKQSQRSTFVSPLPAYGFQFGKFIHASRSRKH